MNQSNHYSIFDYYLADIASAESLTREEEIFLAERISRGDQAAIHKLVTSNLRFVINIAKRYRNLGLPIENLVSEGNVGLMVAARKFDGQHGYKFISYAVHWIRQAILQALAEQSRTVRVPQNRVADLNRLNRSESKLEQQLGRTPETTELAHA